MNYIVKAPWKVVDPYKDGHMFIPPNVLCWLKSDIGERHIDWDYWTGWSGHSFFFKTEENKVKFILKWL